MIGYMAKSLRSTLRHAASTTAASDSRRSTTVINQSVSFIWLPSTQSSVSLAPNQPSSHLTITSSEIAADIKDWFSSRFGALFDQIHRICSSSGDNPDAALSFLHLRLSEDFVLRLLHHHRHLDNLLPCLVFFDWAGRQPGFYHMRTTYHAIFKILSRAKIMSVLLDWLHKFSTARFHGSTTEMEPVAEAPPLPPILLPRTTTCIVSASMTHWSWAMLWLVALILPSNYSVKCASKALTSIPLHTALIEPFTVDYKGIHTNIQGKDITFKFVFLAR